MPTAGDGSACDTQALKDEIWGAGFAVPSPWPHPPSFVGCASGRGRWWQYPYHRRERRVLGRRGGVVVEDRIERGRDVGHLLVEVRFADAFHPLLASPGRPLRLTDGPVPVDGVPDGL